MGTTVLQTPVPIQNKMHYVQSKKIVPFRTLPSLGNLRATVVLKTAPAMKTNVPSGRAQLQATNSTALKMLPTKTGAQIRFTVAFTPHLVIAARSQLALKVLHHWMAKELMTGALLTMTIGMRRARKRRRMKFS